MATKMKIGVYGSAAGNLDAKTKNKAQLIGKEIARNGHALVTGGCPGLPYEAVLGAFELEGECWGFSSETSLKAHNKAGLPIKGFTDFVFIPKDYEHANNASVCGKYRNVSSVASVDAAIIIGGRSGSMNEFTIAYDTGKVIGVLEGTGGITKRAINVLLEDSDKETVARVIFESDPVKLVALIVSQLL
jgi:predicted Rossmann-fold nucleotide-binding protein